MLLNCGVGEDSWESLGLQGDTINPSQRRSVLGVHWKDWCWSWNSNTLATWCEELTHLKRPWCWERLKVGEEGDDRGWDGWMASQTQWTWVWVNSGSWWWTGRSGMLQSMGSQRVRHDWATELNWTEPYLVRPWALPSLYLAPWDSGTDAQSVYISKCSLRVKWFWCVLIPSLLLRDQAFFWKHDLTVLTLSFNHGNIFKGMLLYIIQHFSCSWQEETKVSKSFWTSSKEIHTGLCWWKEFWASW